MYNNTVLYKSSTLTYFSEVTCDLGGNCYITVDFAMAASQKGVCLTQEKLLILVSQLLMIIDECNRNGNDICHVLNKIDFPL